MRFPPGPPLGKRVPPCVTEASSLRSRPAQSSILRGWGDPLVRGHSWQKCRRQHICFGLGLCAENPRICFANPHRLRPPAGVLARSLQTLRVCLTLAPCTEFDSPRLGGSVDAAHDRLRFDKHRICFGLGLCAENLRICFANPHRLRPPAGVLARSLQTLRVCLTLAPCTEFDSPRYL